MWRRGRINVISKGSCVVLCVCVRMCAQDKCDFKWQDGGCVCAWLTDLPSQPGHGPLPIGRMREEKIFSMFAPVSQWGCVCVCVNTCGTHVQDILIKHDLQMEFQPEGYPTRVGNSKLRHTHTHRENITKSETPKQHHNSSHA